MPLVRKLCQCKMISRRAVYKGERWACTKCSFMLLRGMAPKKLKSTVIGGGGGGKESQFISENCDSNRVHL